MWLIGFLGLSAIRVAGVGEPEGRFRHCLDKTLVTHKTKHNLAKGLSQEEEDCLSKLINIPIGREQILNCEDYYLGLQGYYILSG